VVVAVTSLKGLFHMPDTKDGSEFCLDGIVMWTQSGVEFRSAFWAQTGASKIGREWRKLKGCSRDSGVEFPNNNNNNKPPSFVKLKQKVVGNEGSEKQK